MNESLLLKVEAWIEESGRALEMRTARQFRHGQFSSAELNFEYVDSISAATREGDVLATRNWIEPDGSYFRLQCVVECKSGASKPSMGFYERTHDFPKTLSDVAPYVRAPFGREFSLLDPAFLEVEALRETHLASSVASAFGKDGMNQAHAAVRQVLSAVSGLRDAHVEYLQQLESGLILLPVVVTEAPLFEAGLNAQNSIDVRSTDRLIVSTRWEGSRTRVAVMNEAELPRFVNEVRLLADHYAKQ